MHHEQIDLSAQFATVQFEPTTVSDILLDMLLLCSDNFKRRDDVLSLSTDAHDEIYANARALDLSTLGIIKSHLVELPDTDEVGGTLTLIASHMGTMEGHDALLSMLDHNYASDGRVIKAVTAHAGIRFSPDFRASWVQKFGNKPLALNNIILLDDLSNGENFGLTDANPAYKLP